MTFDPAGAGPPVLIDGTALSLDEVVRVAKRGCTVRTASAPRPGQPGAPLHHADARPFPSAPAADGRPLDAGSHARFERDDRPATARRSPSDGASGALPASSVRAGMLLHANAHLHGASRVRADVIERLVAFLNAGATPVVPEPSPDGLGTGDVVPLSAIVGALIGRDDSFQVDLDGETLGARAALRRLGLPPLALTPTEALATIGGTGVSVGTAVECLHDAYVQLAVAIGTSALFVQACPAADRSFHPFVHSLRRRPGHRWAAAHLASLLAGSTLARPVGDGGGTGDATADRPTAVADPRCLPLLFGPIVDGLGRIAAHLRTEANAVFGVPAFDPARGVAERGRPVAGCSPDLGLDQLRFSLGFLARNLDVQVGAVWDDLAADDWSGGAEEQSARRARHALAGLLACGVAITPLIAGHNAPAAAPVDRFAAGADRPTVDQVRESIALSQQHLAIALIFAVHGVDLRTRRRAGHFDAGRRLSPRSVRLYEAVRAVVDMPACPARPFVWGDDQQALDDHVARIAADLATDGAIPAAVAPTLAELWRDAGAHAPAGGFRVQGGRA